MVREGGKLSAVALDAKPKRKAKAKKIKRPAIRWHGGKWLLGPWIIQHFPKHRIYVEPFGGGASALLRKERSYGEVYNDLDGEVVNFFRVLRDKPGELKRLVELTPFSRGEFELSYRPSCCPLEQARRTLVRSFMGFGSASVAGQKSGFRANSNRSGTTPAHDWQHLPEGIDALAERMAGVVIENRDAIEVMEAHDTPDTLHYVDPPYVHETRSFKKHSYRHEMSDDDHRNLSEVLHRLQGMVVLSGYRCPLYDELYADWTRVDKAAHADGARDRVESLWLNPAASARLQPQLFEVES